MKKALVPASLLAGALLVGALPTFAGGGRIGFHGVIVEPSCPVGEGKLDCPAGRRGDAIIRLLDTPLTQADARLSLFDYALHRDPSRSWRLVEVTYR
ncbi:hypothetical protein J2T07_002129 [Luteibacter jiangsuensis]|uniref:Type 1 fimbrial protein n=1 Tax=Luteibacter jiangsuensis TaxID=637577 RepID=A0ABT9SZF3_9GAMM|nr:hypothetical protein [Luteibacter jiangsuensis]MDQ0009939.1 hypothetical protein [Luteibacter jiangsuensis]